MQSPRRAGHRFSRLMLTVYGHDVYPLVLPSGSHYESKPDLSSPHLRSFSFPDIAAFPWKRHRGNLLPKDENTRQLIHDLRKGDYASQAIKCHTFCISFCTFSFCWAFWWLSFPGKRPFAVPLLLDNGQKRLPYPELLASAASLSRLPSARIQTAL